ncbi:MAG TPA: transcriptional regulator [Planktothrix sp. UBA8402]|jgi:transcriptional regulator with XRE-family HTH domain|nr:transcriptional regulator [Planktothrix sp. UBA8402]
MGLIRVKVRELAAEKGWTLKEVADRSGIVYNSVKHYARCPGMTKVDFTALQKLARAFDVMIEEVVEVLED